MNRSLQPILAWLMVLGMASLTEAQEDRSAKGRRGSKESSKKADETQPKSTSADVSFYAPRKIEMQFGLRFQAHDNQCSQILATLLFPTDWPEQKVKVLKTEISPNAVHEFRTVPGGALQLVLRAPNVPAQGSFDAVVVVEVEKSFTKAPEDPSTLVIPKKIAKELNWFIGESPYIEVKDRLLSKTIAELKAAKPTNAWAQVESYYEWVRENIEYRNGDIRSTKVALRERWGDCEEMTSLFIAMCRASGIPARMVWVPEHCYAEFYLEDEHSQGHWYPCQLAGERQFGEMKEYRPILQKGDRFKVPEKKKVQRYVDEYFRCDQVPIGPKAPQVIQLRDLGELQVELDELKVSDPKLFSTQPKSDASEDSKGDPERPGPAGEKNEPEADTGIDDE